MINNGWLDFFQEEMKKEYFVELQKYIDMEYQNNIIYPSYEDIYNAFKYCDLKNVKVVIIGQDPYHEPNQAHGLAFSVNEGIALPPSLKNIYKEISDEFNITMSNNGDLSGWAKQGVFLLNTVLTVRQHQANSHKQKGWEQFTDNAISYLNKNRKNVVYLLWGKPAMEKVKLIDKNNNLILTSPHPSPLSSYRGFFGNNHFIKANQYLLDTNQEQIDWRN